MATWRPRFFALVVAAALALAILPLAALLGPSPASAQSAPSVTSFDANGAGWQPNLYQIQAGSGAVLSLSGAGNVPPGLPEGCAIYQAPTAGTTLPASGTFGATSPFSGWAQLLLVGGSGSVYCTKTGAPGGAPVTATAPTSVPPGSPENWQYAIVVGSSSDWAYEVFTVTWEYPVVSSFSASTARPPSTGTVSLSGSGADVPPGLGGTGTCAIYKAPAAGTTLAASGTGNPFSGWTQLSAASGTGTLPCPSAGDSETVPAGSASETWQYGILVGSAVGPSASDYSYKTLTVTWVGPPTVTSVSPSSGPAAGGTTVDVTGTNLSGTTAVDFGSTAATATSCTATSCTATSPPGSGTVNVTVTTAAGTSTTSSADRFAYTATPSVSLSVSPTAQSSGGTVDLSVSGQNISGGIDVYKSTAEGTDGSFTTLLGTCPGSGNVSCPDFVTDTESVAASGNWYYEATSSGAAPSVAAVAWAAPPASPTPTVTSLSPASGPTSGGTTVTVDGTNLSGGTVDFGSTAATAVSCSSASCTATSPAGSGTVDVTVTTAAGTSATSSADLFAYTAASAMTVSLTANPTSPPVGQATTLSATISQPLANSESLYIGVYHSPTSVYPTGYFTSVPISCSTTGATTCSGTVTHASPQKVTYTAAVYNASSGAFVAISSPVTVTWNNPVSTATAISCTPTNAYPTESVACTAKVTTATGNPTPTGTVDITYSSYSGTHTGTVGTCTLASETCSVSTTKLPTSAHDTVTATYSGNTTDATSNGGANVTVSTSLTPSVALTAKPATQTSGGTVTLTAAGANVASSVTIYKAKAPNTSYPATYNSTDWARIGSPCTGSGSVVCTATDSETIASGTETWQYLAVTGSFGSTVSVTWKAPPEPVVTAVSPSSGPLSGGTVVTVSGTNLSRGTVYFASTAATGVSCSPTSCTATSPAGSATVDVTVKTTAGTSAKTSADRFTYLAPSNASTSATVGLTGGTLSFVSAPSNLSWSGTLDGKAQVLSTTEALDVADATGSGAGWHITLSATAFTDGRTTLPPAVAPSAPTASCDPAAAGCVLAASSALSYPYTVPAAPTATNLYQAPAGSGIGDQTVKVPFDLAVPANATAGTYASTWTFTLLAGP